MSLLRNVVNQLPDAGGLVATDLIAVSREGRWRKAPVSDLLPPLPPVVDVGGLYDATFDIIRARNSAGYVGDQTVLNALFAARRGVCVNPDVGYLDIRATVLIPQANSAFVCLGGIQTVPIFRNQLMTGSTIRVGNPDPAIGGAGGCRMENLWLLHDGRGPGQYTEGAALNNRLTNGESHLEIHGGQGAVLRSIGGWGAVYGISLYGCTGVTIDSPFFYGGVWDPALVDAQECIAQINLASASAYGYNKNVNIFAPNLIGNMSTVRRSVVVSEKTVSVTRRIGPRYSLLVRSCEDWSVFGGFLGGAGQDTVCLLPVQSNDFVLNGRIVGTDIDECNGNLVGAFAASGAPIIDGLDLVSCRMNGQICAINGVRIAGSGSSGRSLRRLSMPGTTIRATLGGGVVALGLEASELCPTQITGYNCANSTDALNAGIAIGGFSRYVDVNQVRVGGGINEPEQAGGVDGFGVASNGTQYGVANLGASNVTKGRILSLPFGQTGGSLTTGTFAPDPS